MSLAIWKGIFSHSNIAPGLWHVSEDYYVSGNRANIWVVLGQPSLVVDAGLGIHNLLGYLRDAELVGEDVVVIATHCHFDHSGGLHHFPQVWVHRNESKSVREGNQQASVSWLSDEEVAVLPRLGWTATEYRVERAQVTRELEDGETVFGMKVLHLPGHSSGSIALLCTSRSWLFTGDVLYKGGLIDWLPSSSINDYRISMSKILDLLKDCPTMTILPGHGPVLSSEAGQELAANYLNTASGHCHKVTTRSMACLVGLALRVRHR